MHIFILYQYQIYKFSPADYKCYFSFKRKFYKIIKTTFSSKIKQFLYIGNYFNWATSISVNTCKYTCTRLYVLSLDVTMVGQNEVTPCSRIPLATLATPSSMVSVSTAKSTPKAPRNGIVF